VLLLAIFWKQLTSAGILASIFVGLLATLAAIWGSPTIQADVLGTPQNVWFPLRNPAILTVPLAFATAAVVSVFTKRSVGVATAAAPAQSSSLT
jgi:cation/acetate symporter